MQIFPRLRRRGLAVSICLSKKQSADGHLADTEGSLCASHFRPTRTVESLCPAFYYRYHYLLLALLTRIPCTPSTTTCTTQSGPNEHFAPHNTTRVPMGRPPPAASPWQAESVPGFTTGEETSHGKFPAALAMGKVHLNDAALAMGRVHLESTLERSATMLPCHATGSFAIC